MKQFVRILLFSVLFLLPFAGCSSSSSQRPDSSYLTFVHLSRPVTVSVDGAPRFTVEYSGVLYRYPAGTYSVNIYAADTLLMTQQVRLERGKTTEIYLP